MDIDGLDYFKSEPVGTPIGLDDNTPDIHTLEDKDSSEESGHKIDNPIGYSKPEIEVETRCLFLVSGGEKRERDYIKYLEVNASRRLRVVFISKKGQGLTPTQMVKEVEESIDEECFLDYYGHLTHLAKGDAIYLISDVDQYGSELENLLSVPDERFRWIISNPAFEMWLYYHFYDNPERIKDAVDIPIAQRSQWLKERLHVLRKDFGGVNASEALALIETAIINSKANYSETGDKIPTIFSTQMHIVAEHILSILEDDFYEMIKNRNAMAINFISNVK